MDIERIAAIMVIAYVIMELVDMIQFVIFRNEFYEEIKNLLKGTPMVDEDENLSRDHIVNLNDYKDNK